MNVHKSFQCLSGGCSRLIHRFGNLSRTYSVLKREEFKIPSHGISRTSVQNPIVFPQSYIVQLHSQTPSVKPSPIPGPQPVKFDDLTFDEPVAHEDLVNALQKCKSVGEQMETLASTLALATDDIQNRVNFCKTIERMLEPFFDNFRIQMFGSTVNQFGFKGCDIDMTFETYNENKKVDFLLERPDIPLIAEVLSGKVTPRELSKLPAKEQILFIHNVFLEYYKESKDPPIFINAYVPLVRFTHEKFGLKCDLTFKNRVAFANTKLMYFFANLDERVKPLMMTLRYWAKHVDLIGKGLMFNTYTVALMIIHFLQTRNPPILPSAKSIISLSNSFDIDDMDDKSFLLVKDMISPSKNTQTAEELLKEFFFYYLYFDFTRVISPFIASSVPREEFFAKNRNPKFRMNSICVQDPMCLEHNVAEFVEYKICRKLFFELMAACKMFQDNLTVPSSDAWGLLNILDKPEENVSYKIAKQKLVSLTIPLLSKTIDEKSIPEEKRVKLTYETVVKILKHVLLLQCNPIELDRVPEVLKRQDDMAAKQKHIADSVSTDLKTHVSKKNKSNPALNLNNDQPEKTMLEQFHKFNTEHKLVFCAECKVMENTWLGRDLEFPVYNTSMNILDKERMISIATAIRNKQNITENRKPFLFLFECYVSTNNPVDSIFINLKPLLRMSFNPILGIFLKEYLPKIVKNINDSA